MTTEALKTTSITNLDASPPVRTTHFGQKTETFEATITPTAGATHPSTYQMVRLPSYAVLHSLKLWLDSAATTFTADVTLYYSDTWADGSNSNSGTGAVAAHVFQTALDLHAIVAPTEYLLGGNIKGANLGKRLWEMAGLSTDPKCFFDIVLLTTADNSAATPVNIQVVWGAD